MNRQLVATWQASVILLAVLIAFIFPRKTVEFTSMTALRCGSSYTTVRIKETSSQKVVDYANTTEIIAAGDTVGLFAWNHQSATVGVLDVNRWGRVRIADSFVISDPAAVIDESDQIRRSSKVYYLEQVRRIQNYLRSTDLGLDREPQKTQAAQVAIWQALGQVEVPGGLTDSVQQSAYVMGEIQRHTDEISKSSTSVSTEGNFPYELSVALAQSQTRGSISMDILATGVDGLPASGQPVIVSNVIASSTVVTDNFGKASAVLPDPLPEHPQAVQVVWEGTIPAGAFLSDVYSEATKKLIEQQGKPGRAGTGFLLTAHRTSGRVEVTQLRPGGRCT